MQKRKFPEKRWRPQKEEEGPQKKVKILAIGNTLEVGEDPRDQSPWSGLETGL